MKASWRWLIYRGSPQPGNPGAFVVRRRVELAARYMLTTDASLSDIALRCGFTDQPHLCGSQRILSDASVPPLERLRAAVQMFFRSECDEAAFRSALEEAAPLYREAPESRAHAKEGRQLMERFMRDALPGATARERALAADLVGTVMSATGKMISVQSRSRSEVDALADAAG